ncbi:hypothetical protein NEPAR04_0641 [Nematocida parisii]|nr:hypothetical protein NEPAR03_0644 [Nematocida parisii]KAI5126893.1 hypothetical protein NEPAR08_0643 [Nematocida parisii]KAI5141003.1 hypothetical protein NEPAR04_0641 [Nematocida parisii]
MKISNSLQKHWEVFGTGTLHKEILGIEDINSSCLKEKKTLFKQYVSTYSSMHVPPVRIYLYTDGVYKDAKKLKIQYMDNENIEKRYVWLFIHTASVIFNNIRVTLVEENTPILSKNLSAIRLIYSLILDEYLFHKSRLIDSILMKVYSPNVMESKNILPIITESINKIMAPNIISQMELKINAWTSLVHSLPMVRPSAYILNYMCLSIPRYFGNRILSRMLLSNLSVIAEHLQKNVLLAEGNVERVECLDLFKKDRNNLYRIEEIIVTLLALKPYMLEVFADDNLLSIEEKIPLNIRIGLIALFFQWRQVSSKYALFYSLIKTPIEKLNEELLSGNMHVMCKEEHMKHAAQIRQKLYAVIQNIKKVYMVRHKDSFYYFMIERMESFYQIVKKEYTYNA